MAVELSTIRDRIRQRADMEHTDFVTDAELTQLINTSYNELYGLLVRYSMQRTETTFSITANGSSAYTLPADFYSLIGVFRTDGEVKTRLTRFSERFRPGSTSGTATTYRLVGMTVVLYPKPASGTYEAIYIPTPGQLSADDDTLDGVLGWEELVVIDCAIRVLQKEEADVSSLKQDKAILLQRIADEYHAVEFTENWTVQNVRHSGDTCYLEGDYVGRRGVRNWRR